MKIKFKIYFWNTIDNSLPKSGGFYLFPTIHFERWKYEEGSWWFTIMLSFLIFGVTFDWRKE